MKAQSVFFFLVPCVDTQAVAPSDKNTNKNLIFAAAGVIVCLNIYCFSSVVNWIIFTHYQNIETPHPASRLSVTKGGVITL